MLSQRDNYLEIVNWGKPEYVPMVLDTCKVGIMPGAVTDMPMSGLDAFGVNWVHTKDGGIPEPGRFLFTDVCDWEKCVKIPNLDDYDFKAMAAREMDGFDRREKCVSVLEPGALWERLVAFMGFENALVALVLEPEACMDFFEVMTEYKIRHINKAIDAYAPDFVSYAEDLAHRSSLFMSPETYRTLIKPFHARICEAISARGVMISQHCCGKCEALIPDFVEMGVKVWNSAQIVNDLQGIQQRYKGKLTLEGGWNSQGRPAMVDATLEEIIEEAKRCLYTYGPAGGYVMFPVIMNERGMGDFVGDERIDELKKVWARICAIY